MKNKHTLDYYLKRFSLEKCFSPKVRSKLYLKNFEKGEIIFSISDSSQYLYFLVEGKIKVSSALYSDKEVVIEYSKPLEILGEIEYIQNKEIYINVETITPCTVISISRYDFDTILKGNDELYKFLLKSLSEKLTKGVKKTLKFHQKPLKERILEYLNSASKNKEIENIKYIEMAHSLKISDRYLRKILKEMDEEGIIKKISKKIILLKK